MDRMGRQTPATLTAPIAAGPNIVVGRHAQQNRAADRPSPRVTPFLVAHWLGLSPQCGERVKADQAVILAEQTALVTRRARYSGTG